MEEVDLAKWFEMRGMCPILLYSYVGWLDWIVSALLIVSSFILFISCLIPGLPTEFFVLSSVTLVALISVLPSETDPVGSTFPKLANANKFKSRPFKVH